MRLVDLQKRWPSGYGLILWEWTGELRAKGVPVYLDAEGYVRVGIPPEEDDEPQEPAAAIVERQMEEDLAMASRLNCDYFTLARMRYNSPPEWYRMMRRLLIRQQQRDPEAEKLQEEKEAAMEAFFED